MKKHVSQFLTLSILGLFCTSGAIVPSAVAMDKAGSSDISSSVVSQSSDGKSDALDTPNADFSTQWNDQLIRERDEAKTSKDQAQKEHDQAQKERDQAQNDRDAMQADKSAGQEKSIQAKSSSETESQDLAQLVKERDEYLQERNDLQTETSNFRHERDRVMNSLSGSSVLDAVDVSMPTTSKP